MSTSLQFHTDAGLTTPVSSHSLNHLVDGSGDPQGLVLYLGSSNAANKFQNKTSPGVTALSVSIVNATALWTLNTAKVVNDKVRTTAKNGYRYKVQSITGDGLTGATEPTWPTTIGNTVVDYHVTWVNDGKLHEATEIKLAASDGGLTGATPGASLSVGATINGGSANAVAIHMLIDDATAVIGAATELGLAVKNVEESPI
jgi:hypothetical protein